MNWFFDGIGTEIVILIVGLLFGINGKEIYLKIKNKQSQKAGNWANQFHTISPASTVGDVFGGDKYIMPNPGLGEFNIRNLSQYNTSEIEHEISKGNNDTLRELCFELIFNQKSDYLIKSCINRMDNNAEKYKLLVRLSERNFTDSEYFRLIANSITNAVYLTKVINICILKEKSDYIEQIFALITNDTYIYKSLIEVRKYDNKLFTKLYNNGDCFNNKTYGKEMEDLFKTI